MPQASEEQRAKWGTNGGAGEEKAMSFLYESGYKLTKKWVWLKPSADYVSTDEEGEAIIFLIDEWDFGGVVGYLEENGRSGNYYSNNGNGNSDKSIAPEDIVQSYHYNPNEPDTPEEMVNVINLSNEEGDITLYKFYTGSDETDSVF